MLPTTRSPSAMAVTPPPTLSTTRANSDAGENGNGGLCWYLPAMISVSKKLSAAALTRTTASPAAAFGGGMSASSSSLGGPKWVQRTAFMRCHLSHSGPGPDRPSGPRFDGLLVRNWIIIKRFGIKIRGRGGPMRVHRGLAFFLSLLIASAFVVSARAQQAAPPAAAKTKAPAAPAAPPPPKPAPPVSGPPQPP